ncbi:hypothetical protein STRDD12_01021 [Streptococcus sp. DD12]|nr:hypothetical protein STRDD12_01021 [Streptococcus sp. DD12]
MSLVTLSFLMGHSVEAKGVEDNRLTLKTDRITQKTEADTGSLDTRTAHLFDADDQAVIRDKRAQKFKQARSEEASLFTRGQVSLTQLASTQDIFEEADGTFLKKVTQRTANSDTSQDWTVLYTYLALVALVFLGLAYVSRLKGEDDD